MAKYKINSSLALLLWFIAASFLAAASGCAPIQAVAAPGNPAAFNQPERSTSADPPALVTITPLVLPGPTESPTVTTTPSATPTALPTTTETLLPTIPPTATPDPMVLPPRGSLDYISLSHLDALGRLAILKAAPEETASSHPGSSDTSGAAGFGPFAFSPDARWLAIADSPTIHLWDLNTGQPADALSVEGARFSGPLAFHPNSHRLAAVDEHGRVHSWVLPAENGQPAPGPDYAPAGVDRIHQIAFTADGSRLAGLAVKDEQAVLLLWEPAKGSLLLQKPTGSAAVLPASGSLLVSPNGAWIVQVGQEGVLRFWNPATGKSLGQQIIYACPDSLLGASFSYNGAILALQCDGETNQIFLDAPNYYSPGDRSLAGVLGGGGPGPGLLSFNRDGGLLAAAAGNPARQVELWNLIDMYSAGSLASFGADIQQLAFSPDGKWLAVRLADGSVELWGVRK